MKNRKDSETDLKALHIALGKLFYAIAMADNKISPEEIAILKVSILPNWKLVNSSEPDFDGQHIILSIFTQLEHENAKSPKCFADFKAFYQKHKALFHIELKQLIWHTVQAIASSYARKNKSELVLLAKLKILFLS